MYYFVIFAATHTLLTITMEKYITEITPLSDKDCFYLVDRYKDSFDFPIHRHDEFELNFVANCAGARRIVGDSVEVLDQYDLALIGHGIEHAWEQHECADKPIREITIQFSSKLFGEVFLSKNPLSSIKQMLEHSAKGISFPMSSIMRVYSRLVALPSISDNFYRVIELLTILHELSVSCDYHVLSSGAFANSDVSSESRRIQKIQKHINANFREEIRLEQLASIAGMSPTAFSRFFKLRTGRSLSDYIIDVRLGHAVRSLVDTSKSISEICYDCGFNNISHFNRIFKKKKNCTPKAFREMYNRHKLLV